MGHWREMEGKGYWWLFFLCLFFGTFGWHRLYVGKVWSGVIMCLTVGGVGVLWVVDLLFIILGRFKDKRGKRIRPYRLRGNFSYPKLSEHTGH